MCYKILEINTLIINNLNNIKCILFNKELLYLESKINFGQTFLGGRDLL